MRKICLLLSAMFLLLGSSMAQNRTITGKVTDEKGQPISNVTVLVRGTTNGTATGTDGTYSISVPPAAKSLQFSFLDFETAEVKINSKTTISLSLKATTKELTEVIVTGLSNVSKSKFAGASSKINEKQLKNQPVGSFDQILQGRVPGVSALTGSGAPGTSASVIIRGTATVTAGSDPLYIVDGIPVEAEVFQGFNPNDFASIDILRDAAAGALYGSRGSAGVIVVTTKKGVPGKMKLGYTLQMGVKEKPDFAFRPMNTQELLKAQADYGRVLNAAAPAGNPFVGTPVIPGWYYSHENPMYAGLSPAGQAANDHTYDSISKINTDWSDEIFQNGTFSNHQLTLSGGTGKTRIYSSLALYNEEGTTLRTDMNRITLRNNIDYADDKFTYGVAMNLGYTKRDFQQSTTTNSLANPFLTSSVNVPYARVRDDNGNYATGPNASNSAANQLDLTNLDKNYNNQFKGTVGLTFGYKITKDITAALTTGIDFRETQNSNYGNSLAYVRQVSTSITGHAGFQTEGLSRFFSGDVRPSLTYKKLFKEKHDLEVSAYGEYIDRFSKAMNIQAFGIDPKTPNTLESTTQGSVANQLIANTSGSKSESALLSGLGTLRYTYNDKYTFTGSYRGDGSSKLPTKTRWQKYYSIGGVWEASKEKFIQNIKPINVLRLRINYGGQGNENNFPGGDYPYQQQYASNGSYLTSNTIVAIYAGNPNLKWEKTYTTNLGLDFEILNRRIYGDVNVYNKLTKDVFLGLGLSSVAGFGNGAQLNVNAGKLRNKGIEVNLNGDVVRNKKITWTVFGNFAYNKNKVVSLGGLTSYEVGTELVTIGLPLGSHYEVAWAGVDAATGQPLYYNKAGNVVNVRSDDDRVQKFGTSEAPWKGGFGSSVKYKGFDLSVLFSWEKGSKKVDNMEYFTENPVGFLSVGYNQSSDLNFWQHPGDIASTPSPVYGTSFSSKIIHDASFLRLREINLSYNLPKNIIAKTKFVSSARLFVQGNNLYIWTKWRGRDPEAGASNINLSEFPNPRTITGGLEINF